MVECSLKQISPQTSFASLKVDPFLVDTLCKGFTVPTPIQQYSWPALLAKHDVVGISETGSGKTLAFSLPILHRLLKKQISEKNRVRWVTIAPTRELALQTYTVIKEVIPAVCVYGGVSRSEQIKELRQVQPVAIVATPGRLSDLLESGVIDLSKVRFLVLDEADRMLDAGFEPAVNEIVKTMPTKKRQTVLFSATWPSAVQKMANKYLRGEPVIITASSDSSQPHANTMISQSVVVIDDSEKDTQLLKHLKETNPKLKVIVFVLYKKEAPRVEMLLRRNGMGERMRALHGDMTQADRSAALDEFRAGRRTILIATDVAARGLDIPQVELVINYTFPLTIEDYVHRIGRTGRGGAEGKAVTFFTANEKPLAGALQNVLRQAGQAVPEKLLAFGSTTKKKVHKEYGNFFKDSSDLPMSAPTHVKFDSD